MKKKGVGDNANYDGAVGEGGSTENPPRTMKEYARRVQHAKANHRDVSPETREEQHFYYNKPYRGAWFFRFLNPVQPNRARLRVERLYWESWHTFCLAVFLTCFGSMLWITGMCFIYLETMFSTRGWVMLSAALLPMIPGYYTLFVIYKYICCCKGYSLSLFP